MGYIKDLYGDQSPEFIQGFLAAMENYAVWNNGKQWIGSPELELKSAQREAVIELGDNPDLYLPD